VLAHLLNPNNFKPIAFQCEDQPLVASEIDRPLATAVTHELMTPEAGESFQLLDVVGGLDEIDPLNVLPRYGFPIGFDGFARAFIVTLQLPSPEPDVHAPSHLSS